jgi:catechol 2,3-dioxygenase-like lactoylglutathione lyase family enzyme
MFNHVMVGSNDLERSRKFYDAVLGGVLGVDEPVRSIAASGHVRLFYRHAGQVLAVGEPIDDKPATHANGGTLAFRCETPQQVQAFHDIAVAHGGISIENPPGLRRDVLGSFYLAYVRDPDGHKLCAIHRLPA